MKDYKYEKPEFVISSHAINERAKHVNLELNRRVESILNGIAREHSDTKLEVKRLKKALNAVCAVYAAIALLWYIK